MEKELKIGIIVSSYHEDITGALLNETVNRLEEHEVYEEQIEIVEVPGTLEIPIIAKQLTLFCDAVICLGAVIRGDTSHYDIVCQESARCLSDIALDSDIPVINGILTVDTEKQAKERVARGSYFADAAMEMTALMQEYDMTEIDDAIMNVLENMKDGFEAN